MRWPRLWPFLAAGLFGVPIGTALLEHVRVQPLKLGVGILLIFYSAWMGLGAPSARRDAAAAAPPMPRRASPAA